MNEDIAPSLRAHLAQQASKEGSTLPNLTPKRVNRPATQGSRTMRRAVTLTDLRERLGGQLLQESATPGPSPSTGSRHGSKTTLAPLAKEEDKAERRRSGSKDSKEEVSTPATPTVGSSYSPLAQKGEESSAAGDLLIRRKAGNVKRAATLGSEDVRVSQIHQLSRRHRLEVREVKSVLEHFEGASKKHSGIVNFDAFKLALGTMMDTKDLSEQFINSAWKASSAAGIQARGKSVVGSTPSGELDMDAFFYWYVANMFSKVAKMQVSDDKKASEDMLYKLAKKNSVTPCTMDKVKSKFDEYDQDRSGVIDYDEFKGMMRKIFQASESDLSEDRIKRCFQEIDYNGNGEIDFSEFSQWYLKCFNPEAADPQGAVNAFYNSYNPDILRHNELVSRANSKQSKQGRLRGVREE